MSIESLFLGGTALIVDDQINEKTSKINNVRIELEGEGASFLTYERIPEKKFWPTFGSLSFLIVDWKIDSENELGLMGVNIGSQRKHEQELEVMSFIEHVIEEHFLPVLLFSQEDLTPIRESIMQNTHLSSALSKGQLAIYEKADMSSKTIKECLVSWCEHNPSVYILKTIDSAMHQARNNLLKTLSKYDPHWPLVIYQTLKEDNSQAIDSELSELLIDSMIGRMASINYDENVMKQEPKTVETSELINLYSDAKLYLYPSGSSVSHHSGDVYRYIDETNNKFYLINITAGCDLRSGKMLFLKGKPVSDLRENYHEKFGLIEKAVHSLVPAFDGNPCVEFKFPDYFTKKLSNSSDRVPVGDNPNQKVYKRIGRLIHPYVTTIQERFSNYICRQGSIRPPKDILKALL